MSLEGDGWGICDNHPVTWATQTSLSCESVDTFETFVELGRFKENKKPSQGSISK